MKLQWDGLQWYHPKRHIGFYFNGSFNIDENYKRTFILMCSGKRPIKYKDWRDAVRDGWIKLRPKDFRF